jgi:hypothetical protein
MTGIATAVTACGMSSPDIRLPDLDRQSTVALLDKQQKAEAIKSMRRLARDQQQRAGTIEKKPSLSEKLNLPASATR